MGQNRREESEESTPRVANDSRDEQQQRDELAARRDSVRRQPLTRREREERWPIG
jgi:hypothetical protein